MRTLVNTEVHVDWRLAVHQARKIGPARSAALAIPLRDVQRAGGVP